MRCVPGHWIILLGSSVCLDFSFLLTYLCEGVWQGLCFIADWPIWGTLSLRYKYIPCSAAPCGVGHEWLIVASLKCRINYLLGLLWTVSWTWLLTFAVKGPLCPTLYPAQMACEVLIWRHHPWGLCRKRGGPFLLLHCYSMGLRVLPLVRELPGTAVTPALNLYASTSLPWVILFQGFWQKLHSYVVLGPFIRPVILVYFCDKFLGPNI